MITVYLGRVINNIFFWFGCGSSSSYIFATYSQISLQVHTNMLLEISSCYLLFILILGTRLITASEGVRPTSTSHVSEEWQRVEYDPKDNCYAMAVHNELMRAIKIISSQAAKHEQDTKVGGRKPSFPSFKKPQEDEDEGGGGGGEDLGIPPIVPMIFKVVGSALSLNSSALTESSFGIIPDRLSSQITHVLGGLASTIFGSSVIPKTTRPPPRRRRRSTTTIKPTSTTVSEANITTTEEATTTETPETTTDQLFKESSLGELPVYASAYAPNYIATTPYPVYANNFLHVLYAAPTTPSTTTVSTTSTSSTTPPSTVNPDSYGVQLPFDYQEFIKPIVVIPTTLNPGPNATAPLDYEEYEYEGEDTNGAKGSSSNTKFRFDSSERLLLQTLDKDSPPSSKTNGSKSEYKAKDLDEDDEYLDHDNKVNRSLGRVGKSSVEIYKIT